MGVEFKEVDFVGVDLVGGHRIHAPITMSSTCTLILSFLSGVSTHTILQEHTSSYCQVMYVIFSAYQCH